MVNSIAKKPTATCKCGEQMRLVADYEAAVKMGKFEFTCPACGSTKIRYGSSSKQRTRVQFGAGKRVLPWY